MAADDEFVTIVPVGEARPPPPERDPAFVTVLTVGAAAGAAEVLVRRPRGARLGLGLKFEGGSAAAEKVRRLLVQSCATDSPAANATTPWGKLIPGDEILAIDGAPVSDLTRIDCVHQLKESDEALKLLVRHLETEESGAVAEPDATPAAKPHVELQRPTCLPPPVPPRKLNKKNSFKERPSPIGDQSAKAIDNANGLVGDVGPTHINGRVFDTPASLANKLSRKSSFDSHIHRQAKESLAALKKSSPEEVRRLVRRLSDGKAMPAEAEVYMDLLSQEWERCLALADAESDDTGSSISTVVDRLGSIGGSVESSIPSTPTMQPKTIDIQKVLNCIENIDSDLLKDIATTRFVDKPSEASTEHRQGSLDAHARGVDEVDFSLSTSAADETAARKKLTSNDKNNNNTIVRNVTCISIESGAARQVADRPKPRAEAAAKPRPMPRSARPEPSLAVEKPIAEAAPPARAAGVESEALLTPTKKNCIESWLQRSEAELVGKRRADATEEAAPEALPRLIDFVPKPQYRGGEMAAERSTPPKPNVELAERRAEPRVEPRAEPGGFELTPTPPESREDGSGASLDTIGELDEGTDTTNTEESGESDKNVTTNKYESTFWEGRTNRSDAEDSKSLSNDETPPTCPRQPPDGVETPCDAIEKAPEPLLAEPQPSPPSLPISAPSTVRLPPRLPSAPWPTGRSRARTSYSRSQDARSECSVKDKIAMFSVDRADSVERVDKCGLPFPARQTAPLNRIPSPAHKRSFSDVQTLDRRLTKSHENLDEVPRVDRSYRHVDKRPEVLGALNAPRKYTESIETNICRYSDFGTMPIHYGSSTNLVSSKPAVRSESVYHARSVSDDGAGAAHKSTLEYLIEQRKKSMSKLRGLMIPEVQAPIVDLPEIKVQECNVAKTLLFSKHQPSKQSNNNKTTPKKPINLNDSWKMNLLPNNIPKYSPAFKRKSLQVYTTPSSLSKESTPERKLEFPLDTRLSYGGDSNTAKHIPAKPPRTSIDIKKTYDRSSATLPSRVSLSGALKLAGKNDKTVYDKYRDYGNVEVKICTTTDIVDSDNDSAVSSTQSSYRSSASSPLHNMDSVESDSSHLSPRSSHYISYSIVKAELPTKSKGTSKPSTEYEKRNVCRSVSSDTNVSVSSSAGSGSQASCSSLESSVADSGKKKVTRTHSVDTINRRNILASAKCRSGRDLNVGSPVVETKFTHESPDRSPSPQRKSSERLTTLASSVSGLSNKGEARRIRSKVIADTDSDSESEINIRQRKIEFKIARLKKNINSQTAKVESTRKQADSAPIESIVAEDEVPQSISQRIIKEIKKTGLQDVAPEKNKLPEHNNNNVPLNKDIAPKIIENGLSNGTYKPDVTITTVVSKTAPTNAESKDRHIEPATKTSIKQSDESRGKSYKVCLKKGVGAGVGLILAGGVDCEAKSVTVHKVLAGSVAEREGLQRGVRVRSINGHPMEGLTHAETVAVLKEPRSEVIIEIEDESREAVSSAECGSDIAESRESNAVNGAPSAGNAELVSVSLEKGGAGAGLGFGLEGGKDSPAGDRPLTIKKLFAGGAAARSGRVVVGAELVSAGGRDMRGLTRTQAWAALKELPTGPVALRLLNPR